MTILWIMAAIAAMGLAAGTGVYWMRQADERRRDDFQALTARRGWALTMTNAALGRPATLRIASRSGRGWLAETRSLAPGQDTAGQKRVTDWTCDEPHWQDGTLILGHGLPDGDTAFAAQMLARLEDPQARRMLQRLTGGQLGIEASGIRQIDGPESLTVMATSDPRLRVDLNDMARLMADWTPAVTGDEGQPVLILSPSGLRLRLRHEIRNADDMENFIDLALAAVRILS